MLLQAVLVLLEDLDIVVSEAQQPHQQRGDDHQLDVDIVQPSEEERGYEYGEQDDDTAHGGGALLLLLALEAEVTYQLTDLLALEVLDHTPPPDGADQEREDDR